MSLFRRNTALLRATALAATLTMLHGCMSTHRSPVTPERFADGKAPHQIRVLLVSGASAVIERPEIVGDSLVGDLVEDDSGLPRTAFALSDIRQVEFRGLDGTKTARLVVGIGATVALIAVLAAAMSDFGTGWGGGSSGVSPRREHLSAVRVR